MSGLPREIIKWLQSLDLTYSVKNPKRDFASGFLVGEILSRYHPRSVDIHAFDNGTEIKRKEVNWEHLSRLFNKLKLEISQSDWEPVLHQAPGSAVSLVIKLYNQLTHKEAKSLVKPPEQKLPTYARPTAMQAVRDNELQRIRDKKTQEALISTVLKTHNEKLKLEKTEPGRLITRSKPIATMPIAMQTKQTEPPEEQVEIRQVEVKTMDKNFRTAKAFQMKAAEQGKDSLGKEFQIVKPALETVSEGVLENLHQAAFKNIRINDFRDAEVGEELTRQFLGKLDKLSEEFVTRTFDCINARSGVISDSMLKSAQEFDSWAKLMTETLKQTRSAPSIANIVKSASICGEAMLKTQPSLTEQLFTDFMIGPLSQTLKDCKDKHSAVMSVIASFSTDQPSIRLRYLCSVLESSGGYSYLLSVISQLVLQDDSYLADLHEYYQYYAVLGLQHPGPIVRANSMSVLASLAYLNPASVAKQLPKAVCLKRDSWWEVQAQILRLSSALLLDLQLDILDSLKDLVFNIFRPEACRNIIRIGLIELAKNLKDHEWLREVYLKCLLSLPANIRAEVLDTEDTAPRKCVLGCLSLEYRLAGAPLDWDPLAVASSLASFVVENQLEYLEEAHVDVMWACLMQPLTHEDWIQVYSMLKDYLLVGLCDPDVFASCIAILKHFFASDAILKDIIRMSVESLVSTFEKLVTSKCPKQCLDGAYQLVRSLYWDFKKPELQEFTFEVLKTFADRYLEVFESSSFVEIMNEIITHRRGDLFSEDRESIKSSLSNFK